MATLLKITIWQLNLRSNLICIMPMTCASLLPKSFVSLENHFQKPQVQFMRACLVPIIYSYHIYILLYIYNLVSCALLSAQQRKLKTTNKNRQKRAKMHKTAKRYKEAIHIHIYGYNIGTCMSADACRYVYTLP